MVIQWDFIVISWDLPSSKRLHLQKYQNILEDQNQYPLVEAMKNRMFIEIHRGKFIRPDLHRNSWDVKGMYWKKIENPLVDYSQG